MIRRSPCEYYLKYLVVHPDKYTNEYITTVCERQQLDVLGDWYLDILRVKYVPPVPFYPSDSLHNKSQRFLFKEKIQQLFLPDEDMRRTLELLDRPRAKEFVEASLVSGAPEELIAHALGPQRKFVCTEKAIHYYRHFFWNIELVDTTELKALLQLRVPNAEQITDGQKKRAASALHKVLKEDPRVIAASLPQSPLTALMSQMRMGLMPRNLNLGDVVEATRRMAAVRALEAVSRDDAFASKRALEYTMVARNMTEMLEMIVRPDDRLREELSTIALRTEEGPVPYIHELSEGEHTTELSPRVIQHEPRGDGSPSDDGAGGSTQQP